ncbi:LA_2444/LA_4059 family outer membrane protein [Leptospira levettii]|uniref:LA_2444/LA_4059 family outer membrane protein n=1 Tax=Leptospira levettii TaxID=2023178 RepID=A0AAW5VA54_9LEPT|nr:LA_2444/LA_4059 family outer membrane protein [Leptospira levettii]MCW7467814.1 LA_2444/LA_4059 family outer membrane protein [Leptospira levettii]MCW7513446.1 LA_2444/LA_4059 family outer membrane protein [Leptospira levettii]MCW7517208.1 LA_2444/LA_4059 family outer membrane protein [Leptospira levettii]
MKKIKKIILTLLFLNSAIFSQSTKPTFETGIKAIRAQFIPFEYSRDKTDAIPLSGYKVNDLRSNIKTINPFFFIYKNLEKGYGFEFEYSKIQMERANYDIESVYRINNTTQYQRYKEYLRNNERSDYKLNFFFYISPESKEYFAIGGGIRKIDRIRNSSKDNFTAEEKIIALGPQIVLKSKIPFTDQLSLNLGLDLYHTQGRRDYYYLDSNLYYFSSGAASDLTSIKGNGITKGIFQGYEANISLKYNFLDNFNLAFGYNYNYAYFKYEDLNDTIYSYSSFRNTFAFQNSKLSNGKEIIRGFYISASTVF